MSVRPITPEMAVAAVPPTSARRLRRLSATKFVRRAHGRSTIQLALAGLLMITVSRIHDYVPLIALVRPAILLFGFCSVYVLLMPRSVDFGSLVHAWPARAIGVLLVVFFLSTITGLSPTASGSYFLNSFSRVLTLFVLLVAAVRRVEDLQFFISVYVGSLLVIVFVTFFMGEVHSYGSYTRVGGTAMYDGNDIGVLYAIGLPLAVSLIQGASGVRRLIGFTALIGIPGSIALTASRGGFLGLFACGIGLLFIAPGLSLIKRVSIVVALAGALTLIAPAGYWGQMATITNLEEDYNLTSETGRMAIWKRGMGYVAERPIFGVGPNNFIRAGWELSAAGRGGTGLRDQAPHNTFLQFWAELGSAGLLVVLSILFGGAVALMRLRGRVGKAWLKASPDRRFLYLLTGYVPVSIGGFLVSAFFTSHAYTAMFYILTAFLASTVLLVRKELRQ